MMYGIEKESLDYFLSQNYNIGFLVTGILTKDGWVDDDNFTIKKWDDYINKNIEDSDPDQTMSIVDIHF